MARLPARCLAGGEHISEVLGRLVRNEVDGDVAIDLAPPTRERVNTPPKTKKPPAIVTATDAEPENGPVALSLFEIEP